MRKRLALGILLLAMGPFLVAQEQPAAAPQQPEQILPKFPKSQLEELVASIALYPDDLLAQILAASTYPLDIVEAARWKKHNPSLDQDDINTELKSKKWDPSVKGLVFFPDLLAKMNDNMDWTKDLGDAFLEQQKDVMDAIQVMRGKAQAAGYLNSDPNQKVTTNTEGQTEIQSTNPETVYVQNYTPSQAYGSNWGCNDNNDYNGYSGINTAPTWPWGGGGGYGYSWALGYRCGWNRRGLDYGSNYHNGSFYKNNLSGQNVNSENSQWTNTRANASSLGSNTQQASSQLQTDSRTAQNFNKGDSAASKELKQNIQEGDRTQAAKSALENADRSQVAARAQNSDRVQSAKTVAQSRPQQNVQPAMSASRNANVERAYSNRGAQSRTVSAQNTNRGAAVKSHAGSAPRAAARAPQRKAPSGAGAKR